MIPLKCENHDNFMSRLKHHYYTRQRAITGSEFELYHMQSMGGSEPLNTKLIFDTLKSIGRDENIGFSCKTAAKSNIAPGAVNELIVGRVDVFGKTLSYTSNPNDIGRAVIQRFADKCERSILQQKVVDPRIAILFRSRNERLFTYYQLPFHWYTLDDGIEWEWHEQKGCKPNLWGCLNGVRVLRWSPSGTQLGRSYQIPPTAPQFGIDWRLTPADWTTDNINDIPAYRLQTAMQEAEDLFA